MREPSQPTPSACLVALTVAVGASLGVGCTSVAYVEGPAQLGPYLGQVSEGPEAVHRGELDPKDGVVERGSYADHYTFLGHAGERLTATLTSEDIDCYLLVVDGSGRVLAEDDDALGDLDSGVELVLPHDALYMVVATSYERETGPYELRVLRGQPVAEYPYLELPVELQRRFTSPGPVASSGSPYHVYAFDVRAGSELEIGMVSGQADSLLRLFDRQGREVASDDDGGRGLHAHLVYTPPDEGRYYLVATTYARPDPWGGASYRLTVSQ